MYDHDKAQYIADKLYSIRPSVITASLSALDICHMATPEEVDFYYKHLKECENKVYTDYCRQQATKNA